MEEAIQYEIIRSKRKTMAIQVRPGGAVIVRVPMRVSAERIEFFVQQHKNWIRRMQKKQEHDAVFPRLTEPELNALVTQAKATIPERVAHYAPLVGVDYGRITIRHQHTRWGSCSSQGNLNFNCLLMLAPEEVLDSVVVHELCHRLEMNHSPRFYREVYRAFPEYDKWSRWLKDHGQELMARL